jgi:hypothetical protein
MSNVETRRVCIGLFHSIQPVEVLLSMRPAHVYANLPSGQYQEPAAISRRHAETLLHKVFNRERWRSH